MNFGEKLYSLRKKAGYSQEFLSEKIGVSRQTISKWELNEAQPEIIKGKLLANLYGITFDSLVSNNPTVTNLTDIDAMVDEIDWTNAWADKYPILANYQKDPKARLYLQRIFDMYNEMKKELNLSELDTFLVLKDMVYQRYKIIVKNK